MFQVGERIGDYEILQVLGAGGMGQVYKVRNTLSDRIEALKVLLPGLVGDQQLADRFLREIKVQASLIHKNIAQLYTAQRNGDQILMLLEFVDGVTLEALIKRGALSTEACTSLFSQILDALSFAHARGVVHRDIKPQNIMVTPDGTVKLMDFGIARVAQDKRLTQTGRTVGSLYYMSPEQIRGAEDIDGRSDLYSLGITLYESATGKRPFDGDSDYTIMAAHLQQPPVPPVERDPHLPKALSDVILAALEKDRNQRFQSADAFRSALGHVKSGAPDLSAAPTATVAGILAPAPPHAQAQPQRVATTPMAMHQAPPVYQQAQPPPQYMPPSPVAGAPPQSKSSAGLFMAIGAIAFIAIAGVGYWQYPRFIGPKQVTEEVKPVDIGPAKQPQQQPAEVKPVDPPKQDPPPTEPQVKPVIEVKPRTVEPVNTGKVTPPPQQQPVEQQPPVVQVPSNNPPARQFQEPQMDPAVARALEEVRHHHNRLVIRMAGCREGMMNLEAQQRQMGVGLRGDVKEAARNAEYKLREAEAAIRNKDPESARADLEAAERMIDFVGKAVGR